MSRDVHEYDDIIERERPRSKRHKPMAADKRAAQFAPFDALTGYGEIVDAAAREEIEDGVKREKCDFS